MNINREVFEVGAVGVIGVWLGFQMAAGTITMRAHKAADAKYLKIFEREIGKFAEKARKKVIDLVEEQHAQLDEVYNFLAGQGTMGKRLRDIAAQVGPLKARNAVQKRKLGEQDEIIARLESEIKRRDEQGLAAIHNTADKSAFEIELENLRAELALAHEEINQVKRDRDSALLEKQDAKNIASTLRIKNTNLMDILAGRGSKMAAAATAQEIEPQAVGKIEAPVAPVATPASLCSTQIEWRLNNHLVTVRLPLSLEEIKPWLDEYLADKVVLAPRALRAAEEMTDFQNVALVYKSLLLLGTRSDILAHGRTADRKFFDKMKTELRVTYGNSVPVTAIVGAGKFTTNKAVKWGTARDPLRTMRIYCGEDQSASRVIVSHLPTHLNNNLH
jgi:hypothetical protein